MDADCRCETTDRFWRRVAEMAAPQCEWTSCHLKVVKMVSLVSQTFYHNKELKKKNSKLLAGVTSISRTQTASGHLTPAIPGSGRSPGEGNRLPTPVFWPREFHGLYNPWGAKESDTTE